MSCHIQLTILYYSQEPDLLRISLTQRSAYSRVTTNALPGWRAHPFMVQSHLPLGSSNGEEVLPSAEPEIFSLLTLALTLISFYP
jgi:hypothetical protein